MLSTWIWRKGLPVLNPYTAVYVWWCGYVLFTDATYTAFVVPLGVGFNTSDTQWNWSGYWDFVAGTCQINITVTSHHAWPLNSAHLLTSAWPLSSAWLLNSAATCTCNASAQGSSTSDIDICTCCCCCSGWHDLSCQCIAVTFSMHMSNVFSSHLFESEEATHSKSDCRCHLQY